MLPDNILLSGHGTESADMIPYYRRIVLSVLQAAELGFGQEQDLALLLGTICAFLPAVAIRSSPWDQQELTQIVCCMQSWGVRHPSFPPNCSIVLLMAAFCSAWH